ncbi:hypothetical protein BC831DRAFT_515795, partial [Entophlyctis helioformis]
MESANGIEYTGASDGKALQVAAKLNQLRRALIDPQPSKLPSFARIAVPMDFSLSATSPTSNADLVADWLRIWSSELAKYKQRQSPKGKKRGMVDTSLTPTTAVSPNKDGKNSDGTADGAHALPLPFPFPRTPFSFKHLDSRIGRSVALPFVECDVLQPIPHPDFFPTMLLAEILSRTEGPLYSAIRIRRSLSVYLWHGQLSLDVYDSSEPHRALIAIYGILD